MFKPFIASLLSQCYHEDKQMFCLSSGSTEQNRICICLNSAGTPLSSWLRLRFRGLEIRHRWLFNHLIPQSWQTWMSSSIPPSTSSSRIKDRPSFTSKTSPDKICLSCTAEALIQGFITSHLDVCHRILPEAPICPESHSFLTCSTPWLHFTPTLVNLLHHHPAHSHHF